MERKAHWEKIYTDKAMDAVSWYQPHAEVSLDMIDAAGLAATDPVIDVGGGASVLVDELLARGQRDLSVLDVSAPALEAARSRLGGRAGKVSWLVGDITTFSLPMAHYALWHDRAVFHFLTAGHERAAYVRQAEQAVRPGGHLVIATFAEDGPLQCSGLPVMRYGAEDLIAQFAAGFEPVSRVRQWHHTPSGNTQAFTWCHLRRRDDG